MLAQIFSLSDGPDYISPRMVSILCLSKPSLAALTRYLELAQANTANPFPPNHRKVANLGLPIQNSQGARHPRPGKPDGTTRPNAHKPTWLSLPHWTGNLPHSSKAHQESQGKAQAAATVVHLVTGHAFVVSYSPCFHPCKQTSCPACGVNVQPLNYARLATRCLPD